MKKTEDYIREVEKFSAHNYHPLPVVLSTGEGVWVWDVEGNKYMDMLSAYSAVNQGHRHPKIIKALVDQAQKITLTSRAFHNDKMGPFLHKLCGVAGYDKALPMNTGAEAVETAIKAARKWGYLKKGVEENKAEIIVCENNFHGRTTTIISFSTEPQYKFGFGPFTPGFKIIPYNDPEALEKAITPNTVAFLVEPVQGEGGVIVPDEGYYKKIREITKKYNVLLIADEIQTGFGRTGTLFAMDREGVKPDILVVGKALGGGIYPVSAILADDDIMDVFKPGDHGSTFGGNPLASAVGMASLEVILEEKLPERAEELGNYFMEELRKINSPYVKEVRGRGLLVGVEIKKEIATARPFCEKLMKLGILAKETHEQVIRFAPPLIIKKEEIDWALERIRKVLTEPI
ncbi:MAG TPA: ornithine--oxo-acid transaminase [candidate division WOR-3 bacterium]|uniref:Ornithine aminotransferase n=1 Tax=candidate division WOR-3 bacterium TaxID=2052148 RepID=A0A7V0LV57_UNCW3|nr:ornithine--oxo-acid transaminase [candidate division WOR-3 bacterium]